MNTDKNPLFLLGNPEILNPAEHLVLLNESMKRFPYFQGNYYLMSRLLAQQENPEAKAFVEKAAAYTNNREALYYFVNKIGTTSKEEVIHFPIAEDELEIPKIEEIGIELISEKEVASEVVKSIQNEEINNLETENTTENESINGSRFDNKTTEDYVIEEEIESQDIEEPIADKIVIPIPEVETSIEEHEVFQWHTFQVDSTDLEEDDIDEDFQDEEDIEDDFQGEDKEDDHDEADELVDSQQSGTGQDVLFERAKIPELINLAIEPVVMTTSQYLKFIAMENKLIENLETSIAERDLYFELRKDIEDGLVAFPKFDEAIANQNATELTDIVEEDYEQISQENSSDELYNEMALHQEEKAQDEVEIMELESVEEEVEIIEKEQVDISTLVIPFTSWLSKMNGKLLPAASASYLEETVPIIKTEYVAEETKAKEVIIKGNKSDVDEIIERFIANEPRISRPNVKNKIYNAEEYAQKSAEEDLEFATETLAKIYQDQGHIKKAIGIYEKLSLMFPEKSIYFAGLIENAKKLG